ncbi:T9SS type A sorting domain-containing protein [Chryseobacterium capnotolerans]|uniref:reprolysin-like metallopeptidase n=1 Tax=Chryseobacterium capnotolerans TaxID=2759528 RepID=UPI001E2EEE85|nr:zinc-dependent metalloprotease family protein [Chryseobacterium capnotolerans]UHO39372.1 T9SS type A sorting domain-containing protein [Chryseobacterium capnotolerans]
MKEKIYLLLAFIAIGGQSLYAQSFWKKTKINERNVIESKRNIGADYSNAYILDINQLKSALQAAPVSKTGAATQSTVTIDFPGLDGKFEKYSVFETSNMAPELAAKFPDIKSYRGTSVNDPGKTISFGLSPKGVNIIIFSPGQKPTVIEPATKDASIYLVSPAVPEMLSKINNFECQIQEKNAGAAAKVFPTDNTNDQRFRTYRLAASTDGEFSEYHGGTLANSIAAINNLMSYINPVYERGLSIHMNLVANNDQLIFLDKTTDPYSTYASSQTLDQEIKNTLNNTIGSGNYDLGMLFSNQNTGGGKASEIGSVCNGGFAYIGGFTPEGFIYAIAAAHEMGHMFGANHTFSKPENVTIIPMFLGQPQSAQVILPETGANRETGSGVTVMGYPGVTGVYDVADKFNDQFLHYSISQINKYVKTTSCATITELANNPPTVNAGSDYTIPKGTAFKLTATGTDPDNNSLTYSWEESDIAAPNPNFEVDFIELLLNPAGVVQNQIAPKMKFTYPDRNSALNPNFRVYSPTSSPTRYLPPLNEVLEGSLYSTWNMTSDVARSMKFISLVRDNATGGGQTATDEAIVNVDASTGPFKITSLSLNQNYSPGSSHLLKWNVAGTNAAPINTQSVNILISTDGGVTFTPLVSNTSNDGEEMITIPSTSSQKAFIIVESVGNIYYAASPAFAIGYNITMNCTQYPADGTFAFSPGSPASININVSNTTLIEDINIIMDLTYTDIKESALKIKSPSDQNEQIFWLGNCSGTNVLKATFDQEGESPVMNCNNLGANPHIEPIRLDLSKYYGQSPNGNWIIKALHTSDVLNNVTANTSSGTVKTAAIELCTRQPISTLAVSDTAIEKDGFEIYPNPSNGKFNVLMKKNTTSEVHIFDIAGRLVHSQSGITNDTRIDLTSFAKGNYIMVFNAGGKKVAKKVIIK